MGYTYAKVTLSDPSQAGKKREVELLVDTGAILTAVPRSLLMDLGVKPVGSRKLRTYSEETIEREGEGSPDQLRWS